MRNTGLTITCLNNNSIKLPSGGSFARYFISVILKYHEQTCAFVGLWVRTISIKKSIDLRVINIFVTTSLSTTKNLSARIFQYPSNIQYMKQNGTRCFMRNLLLLVKATYSKGSRRCPLNFDVYDLGLESGNRYTSFRAGSQQSEVM